ncbi:lipopolysaccharide assembly protein LapA domain-containing protein [Nocardia sp. NPDC005366]|uniref:LapA family protein n=1 Tax=Nocardia sp. NPDC005366 TaxID=3156878 RepID=UPI0033B57DCE
MSTNAEELPDPESIPPQATPRGTAKKSISSRTGYAWVGLVAGALILIVLLIFILQNLQSIRVSLFFWEFNLPIGVAVLLSVIGGALVMALVGGVRIMQLRHAAKR